MDFMRFLSALVAAAVVYSAALSSVPTALAAIAFFVMLSAGWSEARFERIMKAINSKWGLD